MDNLELIGKNAEGFTWYKNISLTKYAESVNLKGFVVCDVFKDDTKGRVLIKGKNIIAELSLNAEEAAVKIDIISFKLRNDEVQEKIS